MPKQRKYQSTRRLRVDRAFGGLEPHGSVQHGGVVPAYNSDTLVCDESNMTNAHDMVGNIFFRGHVASESHTVVFPPPDSPLGRLAGTCSEKKHEG
jgi:hypothetical protein